MKYTYPIGKKLTEVFKEAYEELKKQLTPEILIKYHADIPHLQPIDGDKSDWIDLYAAEDVTLHAGESAKISLGISMKLPDGYEAHVLPRSSTFDKWGILQTNSTGIIDNSYSGDNDIWKYPVYAVKDTQIHKGDRICQFRILNRMGPVRFSIVEMLGDNDRGGFGSTGER